MSTGKFVKIACAVAAAGWALLLTGFFTDREVAFRSYLWAYLFWFSLGSGSLALLMIHHLTGGAWGRALMPFLESATRTFPVLAILFVPIVFGIRHLYEWARPEAAHDAVLKAKAVYLNAPFFTGRAAVYFGVWIILALFLNRWSGEFRRKPSKETLRRLQGLSGVGLVLFGLTGTFAAFDWAESIEPHWHSTIYGLQMLTSQTLGAFAFVVLFAAALALAGKDRGPIRAHHLHDFGNLLLAFVMLWAYLGFSQFIIIWWADLPEENIWYFRRGAGGWQWVAAFLAVVHFALPFFALLMRGLKRNARALFWIAAWIFAARAVDLYWMIFPAFRETLRVDWRDAAAMAAVGGVWIACFLMTLARRGVADPESADEEAPHEQS